MAAFLLWNVHRKPLDSLVQSLVIQHSIDIVLLVEYAFGLSQLSNLLLANGLVKRSSPKRFAIFAPASHRIRWLNYRLGSRASFWKWVPPSGQEGLIVLLHGFDRRNYDDSSRRLFFRRVAEAVQRRETSRQHQRTIIAGDFNVDPYESAIAAADGLHAIGLRTVKSLASRKVRAAGGRSEFFYNPMWRLYGQPPHREAGSATHYWTREWTHELGWHMLDQVVLRPGELPRFPEDRLQILTAAGSIPLLDVDGLPDQQTASDHLPVLFHWNL